MMDPLEKINTEIKLARTKLAALYERRKKIPKAPNPDKTEIAKIRRRQIIALAQEGKIIKEIADIVGVKPATVKYHLTSEIYDLAHTALLLEGRASIISPNEHGGTTWNVDYRSLLDKSREIDFRLFNGLTARYWKR